MTIAREYLRVSADKSGTMRSPAEQHDDNVLAADDEGWVLEEPYEEADALSASRYSRKARPGFDSLVGDLKAGRFGADVLILWESSRGSRRLSEWARFLEMVEDAGVRIHITSHGRTYDPSKARDRRSLQEDGTNSEYESAQISVRAIRSVNSRAAKGEPHGRVPWGYIREYGLNDKGKRIIIGQYPDPVTAPIVERIYEAIGKKQTLRAIAAGLNADGILTPKGKPWTGQTVRDIALTPAYAGLRIHVAGRYSGHDRSRHGTLIPGTWKGIVSLEQWHATRALLTDPKRRTSRPGRDKHLLSMIATCDVCGGLLTVRYSRGRGEYSCREGGHVRIAQDDLDEFVTGMVLGRLAERDSYPRVTEKDTSADLQVARDELAAAEAHHRQLIEMIKQHKLSPLAGAELEPAALADVEKARTRLLELQSPPALLMLLGDPGEDIKVRWEAAGMSARREVVRILFERLAVGRASSPGHRTDVTERLTYKWRGGPG